MAAKTKRKRLTRQEQKAQTRERFRDAAATVFIARGFERASVEEISAEAGYTRGAFYSNYAGKEELFFEVLQQGAYREYTRMLEETPSDLGPREQLRWGAEQLVERYSGTDEQRTWLSRLWLECMAVAARDEQFRELAANFWKGNRGIVADRIRSEYERVGARLPIEAEHIASAMTALDIGLFLQNLVDAEAVPLKIYPPLYDLLFGELTEPSRVE